MADYRADAEDNAQDKEDADVKFQCPLLSLWGAATCPTRNNRAALTSFCWIS
jgi:hypothetical protein